MRILQYSPSRRIILSLKKVDRYSKLMQIFIWLSLVSNSSTNATTEHTIVEKLDLKTKREKVLIVESNEARKISQIEI